MKAASIAAGILLSGMAGSADAGESLLVTTSSASSVIAYPFTGFDQAAIFSI
jgi:hypothetical protein